MEHVRGIMMNMIGIAEVILGVGNVMIEGIINLVIGITGVRKGIVRNITGVNGVAVRIVMTITGIVKDAVGIIKTEIRRKGSIRRGTIVDMIEETEMIVIGVVEEVGIESIIETQEMTLKVRVQIVHEIQTDLLLFSIVSTKNMTCNYL